MKLFKTILLIAIVLISNRLHAQDDKIAAAFKGFGSVQHYSGSLDERSLTSKEVNSTFRIYVYLPITYTDTKKKYPLLVITDAFWSMGIAQTTFDLLSIGKEIPEVIVVGIGYPYMSLLEMGRNRFRDMTPTHVDGYDPSGSADKFIAFIKKELFPYIENNYRVDTTDRCYCGHSLGGLLGSHILIEQPYLFKRYILGSPSYWWDQKEIINRISGKRSLSSDSIKAIYTFTGSLEGAAFINDWKRFDSVLVSKSRKNLKFHDQIYQDESHMSVTPAAFSAAVKFVYKK